MAEFPSISVSARIHRAVVYTFSRVIPSIARTSQFLLASRKVASVTTRRNRGVLHSVQDDSVFYFPDFKNQSTNLGRPLLNLVVGL